MTYKYSKIRMEIYESRERNPSRQYRSFKEFKKVFNKNAFILMGMLCFFGVIFISVALKFPDRPYFVIPFLISVVLTVIYEHLGEKVYNREERASEIAEVQKDYELYIKEITEILEENNVYSKEKINILIKESENRLSLHNKKFEFVKSDTYEKFIGVPLGAAITLIINDSGKTTGNGLLFVILLGWILVKFINICKMINFHSEGYFKDKYLLDVLKEIQYVQ